MWVKCLCYTGVMSKRKKLGITLALTLVFTVLISQPTWAENSCGGVDTALIKCEETGSGAIGRIALDVVEILSIGVGILGVIGITVVGIQYMTAGGNEEKTRKAKRRMFEIVLGLVAYAILFGFIQWLGASPDENAVTESNGSFESSAKTPKKEKQKTTPKKKKETDKNGTTAKGQKVLKSAQKLAEKMDKAGIRYQTGGPGVETWSEAKSRNRLDCAEYVSLALQDAGLIPKGKTFWLGHGKINGYKIDKDKDFKATYTNKSIKNLVKSGKLVPGDIVGHSEGPHTMIYKGKKNGKYYFYSVNSPKGNLLTVSKVTKKTYPGSYKVFVVIHPK